MSTFQRTHSVSSCSSESTSATNTSISSVSANKPKGEIPFVRKRLLHEQTIALLAVFEQRTHPSKEERTDLAAQLGLELKTVSAWFQNRRRSLKKKSLVWSRNGQENRYEGIAYPPGSGKKHVSRQESAISLDCIASSRERPTNSDLALPLRPPLIPRRTNTFKSFTTPTKQATNLWDHIPSSPPLPPSSPGAETIRLSALPKRAKTLRSLEWACAKARAGGAPKEEAADDDWDVAMLVLEGGPGDLEVDLGEETEVEEYEAITPDVSAVQLTTLQSPPGVLMGSKDSVPPPDDMEAAMALLGFMSRRL